MSWLKGPHVWFPLAVLVLSIGGVGLLHNAVCRAPADAERSWFRWWEERYAWAAVFDAVSATCGVGLLAYDVDQEYTAAGRWGLTALGVLGAAAYLAAMLQAARRLWASGRVASATQQDAPFPAVRTVLLAFMGLLVVSIPLAAGLELLCAGRAAWTPAGGWNGSATRALSAVAALGWLPGSPPRACTWIYALLGVLGGLGWTFWLLPVATMRRRYLNVGRLLVWIGGYLAFLLVSGAAIFALEAPRGGGPASPPEHTLTGQPAGPRLARCLVQTVAGATAGIPSEQLNERHVADGTRAGLALALLVGPLGGAPGGGLSWTLLLWALLGGGAALLGRRTLADPLRLRCLLAGAAGLLLLAGLAVIVALGLLIIETRVVSAFQHPPTFAAALLDGASAVAGANLSAGLFATVTSPNLSSGIQLPVDLYQYGMTWLMAAMVIGRVLPVYVLARAAALALPPAGPPPVESADEHRRTDPRPGGIQAPAE